MLLFGFLKLGHVGLIVSSFLSVLPSLCVPYFYVKANVPFSPHGWKQTMGFYKTHARLPVYLGFAQCIEQVSLHAHNFIFGFFFNLSTLGHLFFAQRVLGAPLQVVDFISQFLLGKIYRSDNMHSYLSKIRLFVGVFLGSILMAELLLFLLLQCVPLPGGLLAIAKIMQLVLPMYLLAYLYKMLVPFSIAASHHRDIFVTYAGGLAILLGVFVMGYGAAVAFFPLLVLLVVSKSFWLLYRVGRVFKRMSLPVLDRLVQTGTTMPLSPMEKP
jgi:hypothetical protein